MAETKATSCPGPIGTRRSDGTLNIEPETLNRLNGPGKFERLELLERLERLLMKRRHMWLYG